LGNHVISATVNFFFKSLQISSDGDQSVFRITPIQKSALSTCTTSCKYLPSFNNLICC
jgi:hypothetical protein